MALAAWLVWAAGTVVARADCSAEQETLGLLRWVDHLVVRGAPMDPDDAEVLAVRYGGLLASSGIARLQRDGHMRAGSAVRQLLDLTEGIVAERRIDDMDALNGVLQAAYLQLSDACEDILGMAMKDWVVEFRELIEDDERKSNKDEQGGHAKSVAKAVGLTAALIGMIAVVFGLRLAWLRVHQLLLRRMACTVACDLVIGDSRFQGFVTKLARRQCRFEFPASTVNDFRAALARTAHCTLLFGNAEVQGCVQALGRTGMTIGFHKPPPSQVRSAILERSVDALPRRNAPGAQAADGHRKERPGDGDAAKTVDAA